MPSGLWRNGRRCRLKICCPYGRAGSSPARPTISLFPSRKSAKSENGCEKAAVLKVSQKHLSIQTLMPRTNNIKKICTHYFLNNTSSTASIRLVVLKTTKRNKGIIHYVLRPYLFDDVNKTYLFNAPPTPRGVRTLSTRSRIS